MNALSQFFTNKNEIRYSSVLSFDQSCTLILSQLPAMYMYCSKWAIFGATNVIKRSIKLSLTFFKQDKRILCNRVLSLDEEGTWHGKGFKMIRFQALLINLYGCSSAQKLKATFFQAWPLFSCSSSSTLSFRRQRLRRSGSQRYESEEPGLKPQEHLTQSTQVVVYLQLTQPRGCVAQVTR